MIRLPPTTLWIPFDEMIGIAINPPGDGLALSDADSEADGL
jgi:hypothetical protein